MILKRLYSLREDNDITQTKMGEICKVSRVAISQWENAKDVIPLSKLNVYANYFNVSLDYIFGLTNIKNYNENHIKNINKKIVGKRLKEFRKNNNITQVELANFLNTSHSTISAYENGKTLILTIFLYQISKKYKVSADWICGRIN